MLGGEENIKTLAQIQKALEAVDCDRTAHGLTDSERELLEDSALALRQAERVLIEQTEKDLLKQLDSVTAHLVEVSRLIRDKVKSINNIAKTLDELEAVVKYLALIGGFASKLNK